MCSLFDLCYDVLGPEATLRRDVEEEEGPEIPQVMVAKERLVNKNMIFAVFLIYEILISSSLDGIQ